MAVILCVEDEYAIRRDIADELRDSGYEVLEADNGEEALKILDKQHVDLVLTDILMPKMNGHELILEVRKNRPEYADIPFIVVSAIAETEGVKKWLKIERGDYIPKPVDFDLLLVAVDTRLDVLEKQKRH